ncbi:MAG TPA: branched-chain amino acid ABC transporter permease [Candidatus Deferrimicrobiaceae bacterium]|nr:branched-chain amino acid ABC transporter permease [Candidatus Deferrimicrobiaceae bacterium]
MFAEQLINGVTLGSIYAIVALGYTLVFGVLDIINMAHGEIFMFGAFIGMTVVTSIGAPLWAGFLGAMLATAALGYLLERFALRPLRGKSGASALAPLISTIGVSILLENVAHKLFGAGNHLFETPFAEIRFQVGSFTVYLVQAVILGIAVLLMAGLSLWLYRTKAGKALRATAESLETAGILGIDTTRMITATVVIASVMGGIAGVLVGMAFNYINNQMGLPMGLKGLAIIIFGGMGSVPGAVAGGILLGLSETFMVAYGSSGYRDAIAFFIIIAVLLVRPQGLFGGTAAESR